MTMLKTIRGEDGKPYISLEDMMDEIKRSKQELKDKLSDDLEEDGITPEMLENRIDFLDKLYESFKAIQQEFYKQIIGLK